MLCFDFAFAQVHEIPLRRKSNITKSISEKRTGVRFSFSQDKIISRTKTSKDGSSFANIWINGSYPNGKVGSPNLPAYKKLIRIPKGSTPKVNVISSTEQEIILKEYGINLPIFPNQLSVSKDKDTTIVKFEINKSAYAKNSYANNPIATIEVLGNLRSATIARLVVNPIDYNAVSGSLKIYNDIDVEVTFANAITSDEEQKLDAKTYSPYFDITYKALDQPIKSSYTDHPDLTKYPVKMLIVSNRIFEQNLQPFIEWKRLKGFNVKTVYTDDIGTTPTAIKAYIQQEYNSATPENPAPSFLVIAGDVTEVAASATGSATNKLTDLYYASIDGDMFPDMYYGRLSASTPAQLENIITKILYYEKYQFDDPSYLNRVTLIAGVDGVWNPRVGQPTIKYGTANYFNPAKGYSTVNEYGVQNDPNNPNAESTYTGCYSSDRIAVGLINYTAHCDQDEWANPVLYSSNISGFSNTNKYPLAIGNCCLSGDFGYSECMGEAWIRAENKGAVTYIGSSPNTFWLEDFYWSVGAFPLEGNNNGYVPTFEETTTGAYDASFVSSYVTTGGIVFAGNLAVTEVNIQGFPTTEPSSLYYWQAYNVLGDPSLIPFFTEAESNQVSYSPNLIVGETSFTVNAMVNSYIAISKDNELLGTAFANNTGEVIVPITPITSTGSVSIVITRPQTIPIIDNITAISPTGPYLILDSYVIDDQLSNGNAKADYNESFDINLKIKNIGINDATNVKVKILGLDDYIYLDGNDSISISDIPFGVGVNNVDVNSAFAFKVHENVPDQHVASFTLKFYSDQGIWTSKLRILLNSPILSIKKLKIGDPLPGGNNDSLLNPGETSHLLVQVINQGHAVAKNINFSISIPDSIMDRVTVSNIENSPFSLESNTLVTIPFSISVIPDLNQELLIPVILSATVDEPSGLTQTFEKNIEVTQPSIKMYTGTTTSCYTYFFDSGGKNGDYKNNENYTLTVVAQNDNSLLKVIFKEFSTETDFDFLYIYDGPTINSQQITGSPFSGTMLPNEIISRSKYLTFKFISDNNTINKGWKATVECIEPQIPACVSIVSPSDGEQLVQSSTLIWNSEVFASFYDVYLGSSPDNLVLSSRVFKPQYSFIPQKSKTYYWRVIPGNDIVGSNNSGCNVWQFTTDTISHIIMSNNSFEVDTILFYDSGGPTSNYSNNEIDTLTFKPKSPGHKISVSFINFDLEINSTCKYDNLTIYNGLTTSSPILGTYCGINSPGSVQASNADGALTFVFNSDTEDTFSGWKAIVKSIKSTITPVINSTHIKIFPNPVRNLLTIESEKPINKISVINSLGMVVLTKKGSRSNLESISMENLTPGVYILIINTENSIPEKVLIIKK